MAGGIRPFLHTKRQGSGYMAIDPATAKALAQAAAKIITDRDARNRLLYIILIAVACVVVVLLIPVYLLTNPMEALQSIFADTPDDLNWVGQFKTEHDDKVLMMGEGLVFKGIYPLPVKDSEISKEYGEHTEPVTGETTFHDGTDFCGTWGTEVFAVADGEVVFICTEKNDYGNHLIIRHTGRRTNEDGIVETETFYGLYAHMNEIFLFEGQSVKQGAVIGLLGGDPLLDANPGKSTMAHLHFEIRETQDSFGIDPAGYIFPE